MQLKKSLLLLFSFLIWATPASAYIDPGSGSMIISMLIGFFVSATIAIKTYWRKLKSRFTPNKKKIPPINGKDKV